MATATFRIWRGDAEEGKFVDYETEVSEGMVVLDVVHKIQAEQANDLAVRWNCKAGKCGSCSAEVNGNPKLMCMTRLNDIPLDAPVTVEPMHAFPLIKDLVTDVSWNFEVKKKIKPFKPTTTLTLKMVLGEWRRKILTAFKNSVNVSNVTYVRMCAMCCASMICTTSSSVPDFSSTPQH